LPSDLDILRPWASRTMEWRYTCLKGTLPAPTYLVSTQFVSASLDVSTQFVSASLGGRLYSCAHVKWPWLRDQRTVLHGCLIEA